MFLRFVAGFHNIGLVIPEKDPRVLVKFINIAYGKIVEWFSTLVTGVELEN